MIEPLRRHMMATPASQAWAALVAARPDLSEEPLLAGWADAGYPLVARRPMAGDKAGRIALGLPLPPSHGKRRIAITMAPVDILHASPPPLLVHAAEAAPADWRSCIDKLLRRDPRTRTFGSLAWQHLTGLPYLTESSDLDLLWDLPAKADLDSLLVDIATIATQAPMRIDGEFVGAAGGVNWAELRADGAADVLVKASSGVRVMTRAAFLADGQAS